MKDFNISKARINLVKLDCVSLIVSGVTIIISAILSSMLRVPDAALIMKLTFIASIIIFAKSCLNIKSYIAKTDSLYKLL